jgi:flagellin-like protein
MELLKIKKKGVSNIVATVLLIIFVISIGVIVVVWSNKIVGTGIEKSQTRIGSNLECSGINLRLEEGTSAGKILIKNNNENVIKGFIARLITTSGNAYVDYKHEDTEIVGFGVNADVDYSGTYTYENPQGGGDVEYSVIERVEIIPRIEVEGVLADCETKKIKWEKPPTS